jgi:hypothetical protein
MLSAGKRGRAEKAISWDLGGVIPLRKGRDGGARGHFGGAALLAVMDWAAAQRKACVCTSLAARFAMLDRAVLDRLVKLVAGLPPGEKRTKSLCATG